MKCVWCRIHSISDIVMMEKAVFIGTVASIKSSLPPSLIYFICPVIFQSELVRRHIQKEFWRVQDVLEGLHKNNSSRGTDTAKHRGNTLELENNHIKWKYQCFFHIYSNDSFSCTVASGASGSFSTNSPASPLSSISLTSPLSPFSPVPGSQASPIKQLGPEVSTGHTQPGTSPDPKLCISPCSDSRTNPEMRRRSSPKPRPKSCIMPHFKTDPKPRSRPKSYRQPDTSLHAENINYYSCETHEHTVPQPSLYFQNLRESLGRLDPVIEETDQNINCRTNSNFDQHINPAKASAGEKMGFLQVQHQDSKNTTQHSDTVQTHSHLQEVSWLTSNICSQEVKIGLRKDVYPDSHPSHFSAGYHDGLRNLPSKRQFYMPESQILFLQDTYQTNVLSLHHSPDLYTPSVPCIRSDSPDTQHNHQQALRSSFGAGTSARLLTYPNNQGELSTDPVNSIITQSNSPSKHLGKVFMQTHF